MAVNKYKAQCTTCGAQVPARGGVLGKSGNRWTVQHLSCAEAGAPTVLTATFNSGHTSTVNARGRCEDAPCCGCYTGGMNVY